jgi:hypothetical protein
MARRHTACVLAGKASEDMIKMVEKFLFLGRVRRKRGIARKVSVHRSNWVVVSVQWSILCCVVIKMLSFRVGSGLNSLFV